MVVSLSALRTGRIFSPEKLFLCFWYSFLLEADQTPGLVWLEGLDKFEKYPVT
jgi:hypothetical protein